MTVKDWFEQRKEMQIARRDKETQIDDSIGKLWTKCYSCNAQLLRKEVEENLEVCPKCGYHFRINARTRIHQLFDEGTFEEMFGNITTADPLEFTDTESYKKRIASAKAKTNMNEAVIAGIGKIARIRVGFPVKTVFAARYLIPCLPDPLFHGLRIDARFGKQTTQRVTGKEACGA